jgi:hypothetical protein
MKMVAAVFDQLGVPPGPLHLQEKTLLHVIHYLKTGFGISNTSYMSDSTSHIYGVGQGSKAGPVTWTAVSSILFEAQDLLGTGLTFKTPDRTLMHQRHSDGFVNDTTGYHSIQPQWINNTPSITTIFNGLHKDAQIWERLLGTSGGKLALDKCRFYLVYWKFDADSAGTFMSKDELKAPTLLLTEGDTKVLHEVEQLDCHGSFKTLGVHKTISRNQADQISTMKKKRSIRTRDTVCQCYPFRSLDGDVHNMAQKDELPVGGYIFDPTRMREDLISSH